MESKSSSSKRSINSYSAEEWKRHRPLITRLYFEEGKTLKEVRQTLEQEFQFSPTERMYKSRLHLWGLDKKKKEHEMLELVRMGMQQKTEDNQDPVFQVRGRQISLADALHYFHRKGVKDPLSLLEAPPDASVDASSPSDVDIDTPGASASDLALANADLEDESVLRVLQNNQSPTAATSLFAHPLELPFAKSDVAERRLEVLRRELGNGCLEPLLPFEALRARTKIPPAAVSPREYRYMDAVVLQTKEHYTTIFASRKMSVDNKTWTATSDNGLSDQFYYTMYKGYSFLYDGQRDKAFELFNKAFDLIHDLLTDGHVAFLIYVYELIIRYDGNAQEEPLLKLLEFMADMALTVFQRESHPIRLIAVWMKEASDIRSTVAEFTLRRLLEFFQDSIGYFNPETTALLQSFSTALMNRKRYAEAALRYRQLVDAFETTLGKESYEACYALRSLSEAFFYQDSYVEAVQALHTALAQSRSLRHEEEREIYVRCLRGMAEILKKLGRLDEANATMQYIVDTCRTTFGPDHPFTIRAEMHQKSVREGDDLPDSIPPIIYRLGRGGSAAKNVWTTRESQRVLQS